MTGESPSQVRADCRHWQRHGGPLVEEVHQPFSSSGWMVNHFVASARWSSCFLLPRLFNHQASTGAAGTNTPPTMAAPMAIGTTVLPRLS